MWLLKNLNSYPKLSARPSWLIGSKNELVPLVVPLARAVPASYNRIADFDWILEEREEKKMTPLGMSKHRKSGHVHNSTHFTGKKRGSKKQKRKKKVKIRHPHVNKYQNVKTS